jgi:hypothetical protein
VSEELTSFSFLYVSFVPRIDFSQLPADGRLWVFASDRPLGRDEAGVLLEEVDRFLDQWKAHGAPLRSARDWRDERFRASGLDPTAEQASGCSIDGLFRELQRLEGSLATTLLAGGRAFYRDDKGRVQLALRPEIGRLAAASVIGSDTPVLDTSLTSVGAYRERFERPARETWVGRLLLRAQASQPSSRDATNSSSARKG